MASRFIALAKKYADASLFFSAANIFNFMQGNDAVATAIAVFNFLYVLALLAYPHKEKLPRELANPLRVTAYCTLAISFFLLSSGTEEALFPGLASLFFGIGNFIQSSSFYPQITQRLLKTLLHPAIYFGLGYTMTGIAIGGGMELLRHPAHNLMATFLTVVGITELLIALGLLISGRIANQTVPFCIVAMGTLFFAATGLITLNFYGFMTGVCACAGELNLAILIQKQHNAATQSPASKIEKFFTFPIRYAMEKGWISPLP